MQIRVLFFGALRDLVGRSSDSLELPDGAALEDVLHHYQSRIPRWNAFAASMAMSVNQEYASPEMKLNSGDEVALLPPVSGGSGQSQADESHVAIVREKIATQDIVEALKTAEDGAAVVFEGIVRNHTRGRRTLYLEYEAYEEMALKQLRSLVAEARIQFEIRSVAMVHRLGRLEIGETSVLIAVGSAHRTAAFDACRWLIDTLKRTVPIWKKEYFEDGAVWADGEAFHASIPRASGSPAGEPASK